MSKASSNRPIGISLLQHAKGLCKTAENIEKTANSAANLEKVLLKYVEALNTAEKSYRFYNQEETVDLINKIKGRLITIRTTLKEAESIKPEKSGVPLDHTMIAKRILLAKTFMEMLGLNGTPTQAEIKRAYKKCVVDVHPDRNMSVNADAAFMKLKDAYDRFK
jgi:hypothetical protein